MQKVSKTSQDFYEFLRSVNTHLTEPSNLKHIWSISETALKHMFWDWIQRSQRCQELPSPPTRVCCTYWWNSWVKRQPASVKQQLQVWANRSEQHCCNRWKIGWGRNRHHREGAAGPMRTTTCLNQSVHRRGQSLRSFAPELHSISTLHALSVFGAVYLSSLVQAGPFSQTKVFFFLCRTKLI